MVYSRPADVPYPEVWRRFERRAANGASARFLVQDAPPERHEECVQLMLEHFVNDEPPCRFIGMRKHPHALKQLEALWRRSLEDRVALICVEERAPDDPELPKIVGINITAVALKEDADEKFETDDDVWRVCFGAVELVAKSVDMFSKYGVDRYLTALGLIVLPQYRGQNMSVEILRARIPLCRALGIKVTATVFTAAASQAVAAKAGFVTLAELPYEEMARTHGFHFPDISGHTESSKLMAMVIPD